MRALLLLFVSVTSFAATQEFRYSVVKLQNNDKLSSNCPAINMLVVRDEGPGYDDGSTVTLKMPSNNLTLKTTGEGSTCYSDIVCPTFVSFGNEKHSSKVVLSRNNDGNYPTTDLPGFADLTLDLSETPRFGSYYCRYELPVAY